MEKYRVPNKLPSEEINILAQRKGRLKKEAQRTKPVKKYNGKKEESFTKLESMVLQKRLAQRDDRRIMRNFLKTGVFLKDKGIESGRLILVFRHRGEHIANKTVQSGLTRLSLPFVNSAMFHRLTPDIHALLKIVEPFVTWGYPEMWLIRELIFKYGTLSDHNKLVLITSNNVVEEIFGKYDLICVDDLIHEIMTLGPNFDKVRRRFRSFKLRNPLGAWSHERKAKLYSLGGVAGFRGDAINDLFKRLL